MKLKIRDFINPHALAFLKWSEILRLGIRRVKILIVMPFLLIVFNLFVVVSTLENKVFFPLFLTKIKNFLDQSAAFLLLWARKM